MSARSRARAEALAGQIEQSGRCGKPSPGMVKMLESMEEFEELTKTLVIIDFTASWCGGAPLTPPPRIARGADLAAAPPPPPH